MEINNFKVGELNVSVYSTREEMGIAAAKDAAARINMHIQQKGEATVVFAAAPSQNEMLKALKNTDIDWSNVRAMHMDEYIGLTKEHPAGFGNFLRRAIFSDLTLKSVHYLYDDLDPIAACSRYSELLEKYPPDLILLGVGENGHLAFNDPPVADFSDPLKVKIVELDDVCRNQQVNDGCFPAIEYVPKRAITLTISAIMNVKDTITVVPGLNKATAIKNMLTGDISTSCPASILRRHKKATLYADMDSVSLYCEE